MAGGWIRLQVVLQGATVEFCAPVKGNDASRQGGSHCDQDRAALGPPPWQASSVPPCLRLSQERRNCSLKLQHLVGQRVASDLIRPFDRGDDTETPAPAAASLVLYRGDSTFGYPVERFRGADRGSVVVAGRLDVELMEEAGLCGEEDTRFRELPTRNRASYSSAVRSDQALCPSVKLVAIFLLWSVMTGTRFTFGGHVPLRKRPLVRVPPHRCTKEVMRGDRVDTTTNRSTAVVVILCETIKAVVDREGESEQVNGSAVDLTTVKISARCSDLKVISAHPRAFLPRNPSQNN